MTIRMRAGDRGRLMGEVVQLPAGRLAKPGMTVSEIEVACLKAAATMMNSAATWAEWREQGLKTDPLIAIAEALCIDLVRHNRRHLTDAEVCDQKSLQQYDMRIRRILEGVRALQIEESESDPAG